MSSSQASGSALVIKEKKKKSKAKSDAKSSQFIDVREEENPSDEEHELMRNFEILAPGEDTVDWDAVSSDPNLELWAIRIPQNLNVKYLDGLDLTKPASKQSRIGELTKEGISFTLYDATTPNDGDDSYKPGQESASVVAASGEMQGLTCLLHRKSRNGELYQAPRKFSRHLVVLQNPAEASHLQPVSLTSPTMLTDGPHGHSKRPVQPTHMLRHMFMPIGAEHEDEIPSRANDFEAPVALAITSPVPKQKHKRKYEEPEVNALLARSTSDKIKKSKRPKVFEPTVTAI